MIRLILVLAATILIALPAQGQGARICKPAELTALPNLCFTPPANAVVKEEKSEDRWSVSMRWTNMFASVKLIKAERGVTLAQYIDREYPKELIAYIEGQNPSMSEARGALLANGVRFELWHNNYVFRYAGKREKALAYRAQRNGNDEVWIFVRLSNNGGHVPIAPLMEALVGSITTTVQVSAK
jgi:hypothetical protein